MTCPDLIVEVFSFLSSQTMRKQTQILRIFHFVPFSQQPNKLYKGQRGKNTWKGTEKKREDCNEKSLVSWRNLSVYPSLPSTTERIPQRLPMIEKPPSSLSIRRRCRELKNELEFREVERGNQAAKMDLASGSAEKWKMGCVLKYSEVLSLLDKGYLAEDSFAIGGRRRRSAHIPRHRSRFYLSVRRAQGPRRTIEPNPTMAQLWNFCLIQFEARLNLSPPMP